MDYIEMGKKIRYKRRCMDITQKQLADSLGLSYAFIGHIERGTRTMSLETLAAICKVLQLSSDDLLGIK